MSDKGLEMKGMQQSRKATSFGALVADFYCFGIITGAIQGLYVATANRPVPFMLPVLQLLAGLCLVIPYHAKLSRRVTWLTPGEAIFGRKNLNGQKWWSNPYGKTRSYMFVLVFVALMYWGNLWDSVSHESFYLTLTFPVVVLRIGYLAAGIAGLILMGRGKPRGAYLVALVYAMSALANLSSSSRPEVPEGMVTSLAIGFGVVVLYAVGVGFFYGRCVVASPAVTVDKSGS